LYDKQAILNAFLTMADWPEHDKHYLFITTDVFSSFCNPLGEIIEGNF